MHCDDKDVVTRGFCVIPLKGACVYRLIAGTCGKRPVGELVTRENHHLEDPCWSCCERQTFLWCYLPWEAAGLSSAAQCGDKWNSPQELRTLGKVSTPSIPTHQQRIMAELSVLSWTFFFLRCSRSARVIAARTIPPQVPEILHRCTLI
jgi:hypothetical protein